MTKRKSPQWDDLKIFLEVVRQGSVNAASKRLGLDHTTVGRRVAQLESSLGMKLLDRRRDGVSPREEAASLVQHAEYMEGHARAIQLKSTRALSREKATVRIATVEGFASCYLAPRIAKLNQYDEHVEIELVSLQQTVNLGKKEADLFISFFRPALAGLMSQQLAEFKLFLYASPSYLRSRPPICSKADLDEHSFVTYVEDLLHIDAIRWLKDVYEPKHVSFRSTSILSQCHAARGGAGIVMLPTFVADHAKGLKKVLPTLATTSREVWLSARQDQMYAPEIRSVSRFLMDCVAADNGKLA